MGDPTPSDGSRQTRGKVSAGTLINVQLGAIAGLLGLTLWTIWQRTDRIPLLEQRLDFMVQQFAELKAEVRERQHP